MKTPFLICLFCVLNLFTFSQDTLFFKNAGKLEVIVKEVSPTEIQYKKPEMPDGPMYIVSKDDIEKIIYKNGYTEILKPSTPSNTVTTADAPQQGFSVYREPVSVNTDKISYEDTKRRQSVLVDLVRRHPDPKRRDPLLSAAANLRRMKIHQNGTRTGAIIFGGLAVAGTALYSTVYAFSGSANGTEVFAVPPVIFGIAGIALGATSIAINVNLRKKRHDFVKLYNE